VAASRLVKRDKRIASEQGFFLVSRGRERSEIEVEDIVRGVGEVNRIYAAPVRLTALQRSSVKGLGSLGFLPV